MAAPTDKVQLGARLVAIAALGFVLLMPPVLSQFNRFSLILGVPLLWAYLFTTWAVIIGLVAAVVRRSG